MNKKIDIVRAWRDEEYRNSLTEEERASLPENPAGLSDVSDSVLRSVTGGCGTHQDQSTPMQSCVQPGQWCP